MNEAKSPVDCIGDERTDIPQCPICRSIPVNCGGYDLHKVMCPDDECMIGLKPYAVDVWSNVQITYETPKKDDDGTDPLDNPELMCSFVESGKIYIEHKETGKRYAIVAMFSMLFKDRYDESNRWYYKVVDVGRLSAIPQVLVSQAEIREQFNVKLV